MIVFASGKFYNHSILRSTRVNFMSFRIQEYHTSKDIKSILLPIKSVFRYLRFILQIIHKRFKLTFIVGKTENTQH